MNTGRGQRDRGGIQPTQFDIGEAFKRLNCVVNVGTVVEADYDAGKVRVLIEGPTSQEETVTDWIQWATPNACLDRTWDAPEVDEQVVVFAPSGDMRNAFVWGAMNKKIFPHESNNPDYKKTVYTHDDDSGTNQLDAIIEFNRRSGLRRWFIKQAGAYRWEIGGKAIILMDQNTIQAKVGTTQLVIKDGSISLQVAGRTTELLMDKLGVEIQTQDKSWFKLLASEISSCVGKTALVKILSELVELSVDNNGVFAVRSDHIAATLVTQRVRIGLFASQIKAWVQTTWLSLTDTLAELRTPGSALSLTPTGTTLETPQFNGVTGTAPGGTYDAGEPAEMFVEPAHSTPYKTPKPPDWSKGKPPYRPVKD